MDSDCWWSFLVLLVHFDCHVLVVAWLLSLYALERLVFVSWVGRWAETLADVLGQVHGLLVEDRACVSCFLLRPQLVSSADRHDLGVLEIVKD